MTTLDFEGPSDLSVGEIRLSNERGLVKEWMATPGQRSFKSDGLAPGYYLAEITPAGMDARSVVFQVNSGQENRVVVPDFAALIASGRTTNFLGIKDQRDAMKAIIAGAVSVEEASEEPSMSVAGDWEDFSIQETDGSAGEGLGIADSEATAVPAPGAIRNASYRRRSALAIHKEEAVTPVTRFMSVGLTEVRQSRDNRFSHFERPYSAQLTDGRLLIRIARPQGWSSEAGTKLRLLVAVQNLRIEKLHLPLYREGTLVSIDPEPASTSDINLEVMPIDPRLRAIVRALEKGMREHAVAVRDGILSANGKASLPDLDHDDPWEAMLSALLFMRFPEVYGSLDQGWVDALVKRYGWAADACIIGAQQIRLQASENPGDSVEMAARAVALLARARAQSSPYFSVANRMYGDLTELLIGFDGLPRKERKQIERLRSKWQSDVALQRGAGASFSWLSRDRRRYREDGELAPRRRVTGRLNSGDTNVVFKGRLSTGSITLEGAGTKIAVAKAKRRLEEDAAAILLRSEREAWAPEDCPAIAREPGPNDDPNKGRFGGEHVVHGFTLRARFGKANANVAAIQLEVLADDPEHLKLGDVVWFCLHPTFNPTWVKIYFEDGRASLPISAWGGFAVGAWLPRQGVELELDLAEQEEAPEIIKLQ